METRKLYVLVHEVGEYSSLQCIPRWALEEKERAEELQKTLQKIAQTPMPTNGRDRLRRWRSRVRVAYGVVMKTYGLPEVDLNPDLDECWAIHEVILLL